MSNNVLKGFHIIGTENGYLKLKTTRQYHWHIPKCLRKYPIQQGDIVFVSTSRGNRPVLVMDVFREDSKEKKEKYKQVIKVIERAPKK